MRLEDTLKEIFSENSDEYKLIIEASELVASSAPTIAAECKTIMLMTDHIKPRLSTLYFLLSREISKLKESYQASYDAQYVRLVKMGRPSNAAIEAEIRVSNAEFIALSKQVEKYEQVKELITFYIRCIDSLKQSAIEILRDSRRID